MSDGPRITVNTGGGSYSQGNHNVVTGAGSQVSTGGEPPKKKGVPEFLTRWLPAIAALIGLIAAIGKGLRWY